jgi:hypothetical protein
MKFLVILGNTKKVIIEAINLQNAKEIAREIAKAQGTHVHKVLSAVPAPKGEGA